MCRFKSGYTTKDRVYIIQEDSHTNIISHFDLHEDGVRGPNTEKQPAWLDSYLRNNKGILGGNLSIYSNAKLDALRSVGGNLYHPGKKGA